MKPAPNLLVEHYRVKVDGYPLLPKSACGCFVVPCGKVKLRVFASDQMGWDHLSVSLPDRLPTWEEMCHVKDLFFRTDEWAMQLHPPKSENINNHPFCLHLWRPQNYQISTPPPEMVGIKGKTAEDIKRILAKGKGEKGEPSVR